MVGLAATLAISPILAWHLQQSTPWSPIATVIATPSLILSILSGLCAVCLEAIGLGPYSAAIYWLWEVSLGSLVAIVQWLAEWPGAPFACPPPPLAVLAAWPLLFIPLNSPRELINRLVAAGLLMGTWAIFA